MSNKPMKSKTSIPFEYFQMTPIKSGDRCLPTKEEMYEQLVKQMTNMDEDEIKNIASIIVGLVIQVRELEENEN